MPTQVMVGHSDTIVMGKRKVERYGFAVILGSLTSLAVLTLVYGQIFDPQSQVNTPGMRDMTGIMAFVTLVMSYVNMGPREIHLDPHTRRYKLINGLPFFVRTTEGPFEEISKFVISAYESRRGASGYQVDVRWAVAGRKPTFLSYLNLTMAYEVKDTIEKQAGLPLIWKD